MPERRFPPPWSVEETDACFIVRDHNGQALAYVYFEEEPGRRSAAHLLTRDKARRINATKLPGLLRRSSGSGAARPKWRFLSGRTAAPATSNSHHNLLLIGSRA